MQLSCWLKLYVMAMQINTRPSRSISYRLPLL